MRNCLLAVVPLALSLRRLVCWVRSLVWLLLLLQRGLVDGVRLLVSSVLLGAGIVTAAAGVASYF
jgi:hypothetical protein